MKQSKKKIGWYAEKQVTSNANIKQRWPVGCRIDTFFFAVGHHYMYRNAFWRTITVLFCTSQRPFI